MTRTIRIPDDVRQALEAGALVVVSHSGGKDSQAMTIALRRALPGTRLVVIHAELPGVEWDGTEAHARATTAGLEFHTVRAGKTFFEMVEHRGMFPSPKYRQCTSDLKRDPINRKIRELAQAHGVQIIINCMGLRAQESTRRAHQPVTKINKRMSTAGRTMIDWLPIHDWTTDEVFAAIAAAGEQPHPAYAAGMSRLSCCFCIMASRADLTTAARINPDLYARYVETEKRLDFTLSPCGQGLETITGIEAPEADGGAAPASGRVKPLDMVQQLHYI